jgi:hypothetical protein
MPTGCRAPTRQPTGALILSINNTPLSRDVFRGFPMDDVETTWTLSTAATSGGKRVTELIITGGRAGAA